MPSARPLKNPFPGMNPWMESRWRDVHTSLTTYLRDALQPQLPEELVAVVEEGLKVDLKDGEPKRIVPDLFVRSDWAFIPRPFAQEAGDGGVAVIAPPPRVQPLMVMTDEPDTERWVEIMDSEGRVITAIEILSPSNKWGAENRRAYLLKQKTYHESGVNLVELDLVRDGEWILSVPIHRIRPEHRTPYAACLWRAAEGDRHWVYPMPLRERLPAIPIPLRPTDREPVVDLQELVDLCFVRGRFDKCNYAHAPVPALGTDDAAWAAEVLTSSGFLPAPTAQPM
ncbi:MAG: DUF4058 family protein [Roseimicrobium sp.]